MGEEKPEESQAVGGRISCYATDVLQRRFADFPRRSIWFCRQTSVGRDFGYLPGDLHLA